MAIGVGDRLPEGTFTQITENGPAPVTTNDLFSGKKVVLFGVPGAFTPSCHKQHLPGYVQQYDAIKAKGVDAIACLAVNDAFVLDAWAKATGASGKVQMLADGNADYVEEARPGSRSLELRARHAQQALLRGRRRWRGEGAERRRSGRQGHRVGRRSDDLPAVARAGTAASRRSAALTKANSDAKLALRAVCTNARNSGEKL